ncbi:Uncharacterised protein [Mycobacteroides abscessus subsp. abscessus]|nr:Uncharacterised protein [Mycobacteroides abscessus subsp. abscessus]
MRRNDGGIEHARRVPRSRYGYALAVPPDLDNRRIGERLMQAMHHGVDIRARTPCDCFPLW